MNRGRAISRLGVAVVLATLFARRAARADDAELAQQKEQDKKVATDLFDAGVAKMAAGRCDQTPIGDAAVCNEARDAFRRAYALYPAGLGALRNAAYVEKGLGLVASAARDFRELARQAPLDPNPARRLWAEFAQKEYEALSPRVPHVVITVGSAKIPKMTIVLDGAALAEPAWGTKLDLDPGKHTLHAEAPNRAPFEATFDLRESEEKTIAVELAPQAPTTLAASVEPPAAPNRLAPAIVTAAGGFAVGVGLGFGYVALKAKSDGCGDSKFCDPEKLQAGRSAASTSTIVTGVGLAALGGGLVWYLLSGERSTARAGWVAPYASAESGGLEAAGAF
jgi:hypothetical protein